MGIQTNDLEPGCLIRRSSLIPIDIQFPCQDDDGIAQAIAFGAAGTVMDIPLNGIWMGTGGRLPICFQPVAMTTLSTDTYTYRIVGEDWFGNAVDTGFVIKNATNIAGRSITRCFTKITSIQVNPTVVTNPGVDAISFGWKAGLLQENCAFPLPFERGYLKSEDIITAIPSIHMINHGGAEFEEFGSSAAPGTPGAPGFAGPLTGTVVVSLTNGSFTMRMDTNVQPTAFGRFAIQVNAQAVRDRY